MPALTSKTRRPRLTAAACCVIALIAPVALAALPASASLSSSDWAMQTLPPDYVIGSNDPSFAPVSCVSGTGFCVVLAGDTALVNPTYFTVEQADLVTTNGGQTWTGYTDLPVSPSPGSYTYFNAISCPTTSVCWAAGAANPGGGPTQPVVAESTDGGRTWAVKSPGASWAAGADYWANGIDCVSATTCWVVGLGPQTSLEYTPWAAETTDEGATWTVSTNLPSFPLYDPNGTYDLRGISCTSALACVAVGGLNLSDGHAQVITTTDGGATWSLSADPTLNGVEELFSVTCIPVSGSLPTCHAAGSALSAQGPVVITSADGGTTWGGQETVDNSGAMAAISCADVQHCWAAGDGTALSLLGTRDGGASWTAVTSDDPGEYGQVSCATTSLCVAATDNALWVTTDGGGLGASAGSRLASARLVTPRAAPAATIALPRCSATTAYARTGTAVTITGQYRKSAKSVKAVMRRPSGRTTSTTIPIGLNGFYSLKIKSVSTGVTKITFSVSNSKLIAVRLVGHPGPAPTVSALSAHAGPAAGGARLTIRGANFTGVTAVYVGAKKASSVKVVSSTKLTVTTPAGTGARYVSVRTSRGGLSMLTGKAIYNYLAAPTLTKLTPASGPAGTTVTIRGTGLSYVKAVSFGPHLATHLVVLSPREIQVTAPAGSGTVNVRVKTEGGITAIVPADAYTY